MITATFAVIDKSVRSFPMYIATAVFDNKMLWDYYHNDSDEVCKAIRKSLGIEPDVPCFIGLYADYLIDPVTGKVCRDDSGTSIEEFMQTVCRKRQEIVSTTPLNSWENSPMRDYFPYS